MTANPQARIKIAIQKSGRLTEHCLELLQQCGLKYSRGRDQLIGFGENMPVDFLLVRDDDIPGLVRDDVCDLGICGLNVLEDWISSLVHRHHLWPDEYLKHLMRVVGTICRHGNAIMVGRGGNFLVSGDNAFRVRIVAPLDIRVKNVCNEFGGDTKSVTRRVVKTDSERRAFIRKYFYKDIADPLNYDMVLNTGAMSLDDAVKTIKGAVA